MPRIKLKMEGRGAGVVVTVASVDEASLQELACRTFSLPAASLFTGFPPRPYNPSAAPKDGDLVEVRAPPPPPPSPYTLLRFPVPGDNSCLFHSVGFLLFGGAVGERSMALREEVASEVLANREFWTPVILGRSNDDYASYIRRPTTWGGATELFILSSRYKVEIVAVEVRSSVAYHFGEFKYEKRIFLIYSGCHYDALVLGTGVEPTSRLLPAAEPRFKESAMAVAAEARANKQFVDIGALQLKCADCGFGVNGEGAVAHAKATGHYQFNEWR